VRGARLRGAAPSDGLRVVALHALECMRDGRAVGRSGGGRGHLGGPLARGNSRGATWAGSLARGHSRGPPGRATRARRCTRSHHDRTGCVGDVRDRTPARQTTTARHRTGRSSTRAASSVVLQLCLRLFFNSWTGSTLERGSGSRLRVRQAAGERRVGMRQPASGAMDRFAVSPCWRAWAAKKAARRVETIRASLHGHPSTRHPRRPRAPSEWKSCWLNMGAISDLRAMSPDRPG
jgi:hypothetical protein